MIGSIILTVYGLITALGGILATRKGNTVGLARGQAILFSILGLAIVAAAIWSFMFPIALFWLVAICLASLMSRIWNGMSMGRVHPSHIAVYGVILLVGIIMVRV